MLTNFPPTTSTTSPPRTSSERDRRRPNRDGVDEGGDHPLEHRHHARLRRPGHRRHPRLTTAPRSPPPAFWRDPGERLDLAPKRWWVLGDGECAEGGLAPGVRTDVCPCPIRRSPHGPARPPPPPDRPHPSARPGSSRRPGPGSSSGWRSPWGSGWAARPARQRATARALLAPHLGQRERGQRRTRDRRHDIWAVTPASSRRGRTRLAESVPTAVHQQRRR